MAESLAALQRWMIGAIAGGPTPPEAVSARIDGDERLSADGRLAVYAGGYRARLIESLREEYPALRLLVGDTVFDLFATGYIAARPPRHFSLYALGAGFADYLEATRPERSDVLSALPAAVARLERARAEADRAEGVERLAAPPLTAAAAMLPGVRLRLPDSVRLLACAFDLVPLIEASERGGAAVVPEAAPGWLAVARSRWRVRLHRLERWQYHWLEALGADGGDVQEAARAAARASARDGGAVLAELALWLPSAGQSGLVVAA
jgi:hypothetical protein